MVSTQLIVCTDVEDNDTLKLATLGIVLVFINILNPTFERPIIQGEDWENDYPSKLSGFIHQHKNALTD